MKLNFSSLLIAIGFAISLFSCTDHRLGGDLSPARLRLKTVQNGTAITTYTYDNQSRLSSISKPDGSLGIFLYGDPDHKYSDNDFEANSTLFVQFPNPADPTTGTITLYPLNLNGTSFSAAKYNLVNSKFSVDRIREYQYNFDANKHITNVYRGYPNNSPLGDNFLYSYTGENITTGDFHYSGGHFIDGPYTYTYDDKINPFFGLLDPDIDDISLFSRSNPLAKTGSPNTSSTATYEYEYNQQNLPIKSTAKVTSNSGTVTTVLIYTYESY